MLIDTYRAREVAVRPNTVSAPVNLFEKGKLSLQPTGAIGLDDTNYLTDSVTRGNRDQQMDVVFVSVNLFEDNVRVVVFDSLDFNQ